MKKTLGVIGSLLLAITLGACSRDASTAPATSYSGTARAMTQSERSTNGAAGQTPAFYDGELFTVNMKEMPEDASGATLETDPRLNQIYASNDLDEAQEFIPVIDAIQGDAFNPLWRQNLIEFNLGFTPHQFTSEEDVEEAASGTHPEITIVPTDEVYRCSVVGQESSG